jgi:release factor glutamine methyltransferase
VLESTPSATPRLDAELLVGHVLDLSRTQLLARPDQSFTAGQSQDLQQLVKRRVSGEPIAYLTGRKEFMQLTLAVGPGALVPRPETELLVEWAMALLREQMTDHRRLVIDVGTGTGAIALSLALALSDPNVRVVASDVSADALFWATVNREQCGLTSRVHLVQGDLVSWLGTPATLILANLPYLRPDQATGNWEIGREPDVALVSGDDGLEAIRRLLADAGRVLAADGAIGLEIDPSQAASVVKLMEDSVPGLQPRVLRDLAGQERFVVGLRGRLQRNRHAHRMPA